MSEKVLEIRHFRAFAHLEGPGVAPSWAAGVAPDGRNEKNGSNGTGLEYNQCGQEAKKEILASVPFGPAALRRKSGLSPRRYGSGEESMAKWHSCSLLWAGLSLAIALPEAGMAQCTTSNGVTTCTATGQFQTGGQSMFAGNSQITASGTAGTSWNDSGSAGSIGHASVLGIDLGNYGAQVGGSTSGNVSVSGNVVAGGGTVGATVPFTDTLTLPSSVHPGDSFTVNSSLSFSNAGFTTQSPGFGLGAAVGFQLTAGVSAEACFVGCAGFNNTNLVDTPQYNLTVLQYNEQGPVTDPTLGGNQWIALNQNVTSSVNSKGSGSVSVDGLSLTYNVDPNNLSFTSTSTASGNGLYTASGQTPQPVVGLDLNVANAVASALGLPAASGNLGASNFVCDSLGIPCGSAVLGVLNSIKYNLISADVTLEVSPSQKYSMSLNGAGLSLQMDETYKNQSGQQVTTAVGSPVAVNADGSATFTYPTVSPDGTTVSSISFTPTLTLNDPTFTTQTGLTLVPGFKVSGLSLSYGSLSIGPLFDYSPSLPSIPQLTLDTQQVSLGGFSAAMLSSPTVTANTTVMSTSGISTNINFQNLDATGQSINYFPSLTINDSSVKGGTFNGAPGTSVTITNDVNATGPTSLYGTTINGGAGGGFTTGGNVLISNSALNFGPESTVALAGNITSSTLNTDDDSLVGFNENYSNLTISNSTINVGKNTLLDLAGNTREIIGSTVVLDRFSEADLTGIVISNSVIKNAPDVALSYLNGVPKIFVQDLTLQNSTLINQAMEVYNVSLTNSSFTGDVRVVGGSALTLSNSTLQTLDQDPLAGWNSYWENASIAVFGNNSINLLNGSRMTLGTGDTLYLDGTINVGAGSVLQGGAAGVVNGYDGHVNIAPGGTFNTGTNSTVASLAGNGFQVNNAGGTINLGAGSTIDAVSFLNSSNTPGSVINILSGAPVNLVDSTVTGMSLIDIAAGGTLNMEPILTGTTLQADSLVNEGTLTGSGQVIANLRNFGTIAVASGDTMQLTNVSNQGNLIVGVWGSVTLQQLTQSAGSTEVDGILVASSPIEISGGAVVGSGVIQGSLENSAGIVNPWGLTITGDYTQDLGGMLLIDILGLGYFSSLDVLGTADLAGTLDVVLDDGFLSQLDSNPALLGTSFDFLDLGSLLGDFTNFVFTDSSGNPLPYNFTWDVSDTAGHMYLIWSTADDCASLGQAILNGNAAAGNCSSNLPADGTIPADFLTQYTGQGQIDARNFPSAAPIDLTPTVPTPEPESLLLLATVVAVIGLNALSRRQRSGRKRCRS